MSQLPYLLPWVRRALEMRRQIARDGCIDPLAARRLRAVLGLFPLEPRVPELQRLHRWHHPWTSVGRITVAAPVWVRLIWTGRNGRTAVIPAVGVVRDAVDRDPREDRYRTAALYAILPALSHLAALPTFIRTPGPSAGN